MYESEKAYMRPFILVVLPQAVPAPKCLTAETHVVAALYMHSVLFDPSHPLCSCAGMCSHVHPVSALSVLACHL